MTLHTTMNGAHMLDSFFFFGKKEFVLLISFWQKKLVFFGVHLFLENPQSHPSFPDFFTNGGNFYIFESIAVLHLVK